MKSIVPMMFLYEARARASYRSIIGTIGNPFWLNWGQEEHICQTQVFGPGTWVMRSSLVLLGEV